jgi:alkylation response protein AidB-like acyl-CoA dehydrogenase
MQEMGKLGLLGVLVPEEYGGAGLGYNEYITAIIEITKVCSSVGLSMAAHNSLCTGHILQFGNEEQKKKWLPKLATGEWIGAWGLTEANTGSDAMRMQCVAKQDGNDWVLNGSKNWITHGITGDVAVVLARTGELLDSNGITAFVVERGTKGFKGGKKENKLGMRASETAEMIFEDCRIPSENILGKVGDGFKQAMKILDGGRISIASLSIGIAKGSYEAALKYSKERHQFGQPIANFQAIGFKLADMATRIEASELLTYQAADLKMRHLPMTKESALAKYYASEVCVWAAVRRCAGDGRGAARWHQSLRGQARCAAASRGLLRPACRGSKGPMPARTGHARAHPVQARDAGARQPRPLRTELRKPV